MSFSVLWLLIYSLCITSWFSTVVVLKGHLISFLTDSYRGPTTRHSDFIVLGWILNISILKKSSRNFNGISRVEDKCPRESPVHTWFYKPSLLFSSQTFCPDCRGQRVYLLLLRLRPPIGFVSPHLCHNKVIITSKHLLKISVSYMFLGVLYQLT